MSILKRKQVEHESEIEQGGESIRIVATFETVGRIGSWKRQDYRNDARKKIMGDEEGLPTDRAQFRSYWFHLYEAANIFGAISSLKINDEEFNGDWTELFEEIPDMIIEEWLGEVYSLNPQWAPKLREEEKN